MIEGTDYRLTPLLSEDEIQDKIRKIGQNLSGRFKNEVPIFIGVLNGSFIFLADLLRTMTINCEMDFIKLNSYSDDKPSGTIRLLKDISADITGRHVVVVEDIV
ncbi:MAG TPA: phosphoribosyltransferase family protein, partial [Candidatus Marinimicrobia bacterium]|nr:phosphoribosyltransferase family protein [Candidatus Neomarinimicrobiota bacterium]